MSKIDQAIIIEIAENLEFGLSCFFNIKTHALVFLPENYEDEDDFSYMEEWQNEFKKLKKDKKNFKEIERPKSFESFKMLTSFVESEDLPLEFKESLWTILEKNKPFRNFKHAVENSDFRENWFAHRTKWHLQWVQDSIDFLYDEE